MTDKELKTGHSEICLNLSGRRLKPAFDFLEKLIRENSLGIYYDECRDLEETYRNMIKYTVEGVPDPERDRIYRKLIISAFDLADKVYEALRMKFSPSLEYSKKRSFRHEPIANPEDFVNELNGSLSGEKENANGHRCAGNWEKDSAVLLSYLVY